MRSDVFIVVNQFCVVHGSFLLFGVDRPLAVMIGAVIGMSLAEFLIWKQKHGRIDQVNA